MENSHAFLLILHCCNSFIHQPLDAYDNGRTDGGEKYAYRAGIIDIGTSFAFEEIVNIVRHAPARTRQIAVGHGTEKHDGLNKSEVSRYAQKQYRGQRRENHRYDNLHQFADHAHAFDFTVFDNVGGDPMHGRIEHNEIYPESRPDGIDADRQNLVF